jgi:hypothetical protein
MQSDREPNVSLAEGDNGACTRFLLTWHDAVRHRFRGTQTGPIGPYPASGKVLSAAYLAIYRLADGRIAEAWVEWDNLSGPAQPPTPLVG